MNYKAILAALVLLTTLVPSSQALIDIQASAPGGCAASTFEGSGPWSYRVGQIGRDPVQDGAFYHAEWKGHVLYEKRADGNCYEIEARCDIVVSDGSTFSYLRETPSGGSGSVTVSGAYKGLAVTGGAMSCNSDDASISVWAGLILKVTGKSGYD